MLEKMGFPPEIVTLVFPGHFLKVNRLALLNSMVFIKPLPRAKRAKRGLYYSMKMSVFLVVVVVL